MPGLRLLEGPENEPLELDELKGHLRITDTTPEEDRDLARKLTSARRQIEALTGRAFLPQVWEWWFDSFPGYYGVPYESYLEIPKAPILSIDAVESYTEANEAAVFVDTAYAVDVIRGRVLLNAYQSWPSEVRRYHAGRVEFTAGYATVDDIPGDLIEAVAQMAGFLYYDREGVEPIPQKVLDIIAAYQLVTV